MKLRGKISLGYWVLAGMVVFVIISGLIALNVILVKYQHIVDNQYPALVRTVQSGQAPANSVKDLEQQINKEKETAKLIGKGLNTVMPVFMLVAIVGGVWAAIRVPGRIARPVVELAEASSLVAEGDLTVDFKVDTDCEIGQLGRTFTFMVEKLRWLMEKLRDNAERVAQTSQTLAHVSDEVADASQQISSVMISVAEGNARQSEKVQETMEMTGRLLNVLNGVVEASREQEETVRQAAEIIRQMVAGVDSIARNTQELAGMAVELEDFLKGFAVKKS